MELPDHEYFQPSVSTSRETSQNKSNKPDFTRLCRICASTNEYLIPIFEGEGLQLDLRPKVEKYLPVTINSTDDLPTSMCYQCASSILSWHDLVQNCVTADKQLRDMKIDPDNESWKCKEEKDGQDTNDVNDDVNDDANCNLTSSKESSSNSRKESNASSSLASAPVVPCSMSNASSNDSTFSTDVDAADMSGGKEVTSEKSRAAMFSDFHLTQVVKKAAQNEVRQFLENKFSSVNISDATRTLFQSTSNLSHDSVLQFNDFSRDSAVNAVNLNFSSYSVPQTEKDEFKFACDLCNKRFTHEIDLKYHYGVAHSQTVGSRLLSSFSDLKQTSLNALIKKFLQRNNQSSISIVSNNKLLKSTSSMSIPQESDKFLRHDIINTSDENDILSHDNIDNLTDSSDTVLKSDGIHETDKKEFFLAKCNLASSNKCLGSSNISIDSNVSGRYFRNISGMDEMSSVGIKFLQNDILSHIVDESHKFLRNNSTVDDSKASNVNSASNSAGEQNTIDTIFNEDDAELGVNDLNDSRDYESEEYDVEVTKNKKIDDKLKIKKLKPKKKVKSTKVKSRKVKSKKVESKKVKSEKVKSEKVKSEKAKSDQVFVCDHCSRKFNLKDSLVRHTRIHTGERPYACDTCDKSFRDAGGLSRHIKDVHIKLKKYHCDLCSNTFANKYTLLDHRRIHTNERPYMCNTCGKLFKTKAALNTHNRIHLNNFPFTCVQCDKSFKRKYELKEHKSVHTGEKPFICEQCGKRFRVKSDMLRHLPVHSKEKPFSCIICSMSFRQNRYLKSHMVSKHSDKKMNLDVTPGDPLSESSEDLPASSIPICFPALSSSSDAQILLENDALQPYLINQSTSDCFADLNC